MNAPITHLLIDLDGTILGNRNFPLSLDFVQRSLRSLRKHGTFAQAMRAMVSIQRIFNLPSETETNDERVVSSFGRIFGLGAEDARRVLRENLFFIFPKLERHFYPMPGSAVFLNWAKERFPLILATNPVWPPEIIELRVRWAGIDPKLFQSITHIRRMKACKPHREYYEEILSQEKLQAENCMLVGNEVKMDLPATAVGIRVFILTAEGPLKELPRPAGHALAWSGTYDDLRHLLEESANPTQLHPLEASAH